jgi:hypothetical protein
MTRTRTEASTRIADACARTGTTKTAHAHIVNGKKNTPQKETKMSDMRKKMLDQGREIVRLQDLNAELEKLCSKAIRELESANKAMQNLLIDMAELDLVRLERMLND